VVGLRDIARDEPMTEDTIFAIASMSKPITCVAVMQLVEGGKIAPDDPVGDYLPELADLRVLGKAEDDDGEEPATVPAERPVTIRDLLSHTSGISYGGALGGALGGDPRQAKAYDRAHVMGPHRTIAEQVERLGKVPLAHQPGARWTYGLSHDVLGRVVEVVSGQSFDSYLQEHIFKPLEMRDTSFFVPESKRDRLATIYRAGEGETLEPLPKNFGSTTYFSGGGGLFSTARDYARFAQMLLDGGELDGVRVLKPETIATMTTNQIGSNSALALFKYGLGFGLEMSLRVGREPILNRYFWGGIFSTNFWIDPRHEVVAVLMTQVLPTNHGNANLAFRRVVDEALEP
jgi:CubicO group peptidase (beta-lactamase class C family)